MAAGDARAALLRALAAYMRAADPKDLPAGVRRFRTFRPQALGPHRDEVFAALSGEAQRALIAQWLDDERPRLAPAERAALQAFLADPGAGSAAPEESAPRRTPQPEGLAARLERERDKVRRARAEARAARAEVRRAEAAARAEVKELEEAVAALQARLAAQERRAASLERAVTAARAAAERSERKARKELEALEGARDEARAALRAERKRVRELEREVARLAERLAARAAREAPEPAPARRGARRPLPAPKGLLEDAPETLRAWLARDGLTVLVDGYNVAMAEGGYADVGLADRRALLVEDLSRLARRVRARFVVVFDGADVPPGSARRARGPVRVEYSRPDEIADDHLIARLLELPPDPVLLVTNDRDLQGRARQLGATIATSNQLLALLR